MSITFEEKEITIPVIDGHKTILAMVASNGLAFHPCVCRNGEEAGHYSITHIASGHGMNTREGLVTFLEADACRLFIERVGVLTDWTQDVRTIPPGERDSLAKKIEQIREDIEAQDIIL